MEKPAVNEMIDRLMREAGRSADDQYIREIIVTALKLGQEDLELADIKMINTAMKELRYALKVFYPYRYVRKVAIFGSARTPKAAEAYQVTKIFANLMTQENWMVITGASAGIMSAGNEGAGRTNSFGANIRLPFEQDANPVIANDPKLISFKYFFTRKLIFMRESDATVLCPGGFGTYDEGFETLTLVQTGKTNPRPIICLDPPRSSYWESFRTFLKKELVQKKMIDPDDMDLIHFTHDPRDAVQTIVRFYRNYHSMRYIRDRLVLRIQKPLSPEKLNRLNRDFSDIVKKGEIRQYAKPFEEEENEPRTFSFARLVFNFDMRHYARLHHLISAINAD